VAATDTARRQPEHAAAGQEIMTIHHHRATFRVIFDAFSPQAADIETVARRS
jgi:hypothetical protein